MSLGRVVRFDIRRDRYWRATPSRLHSIVADLDAKPDGRGRVVGFPYVMTDATPKAGVHGQACQNGRDPTRTSGVESRLLPRNSRRRPKPKHDSVECAIKQREPCRAAAWLDLQTTQKRSRSGPADAVVAPAFGSRTAGWICAIQPPVRSLMRQVNGGRACAAMVVALVAASPAPSNAQAAPVPHGKAIPLDNTKAKLWWSIPSARKSGRFQWLICTARLSAKSCMSSNVTG